MPLLGDPEASGLMRLLLEPEPVADLDALLAAGRAGVRRRA